MSRIQTCETDISLDTPKSRQESCFVAFVIAEEVSLRFYSPTTDHHP
jgi:hypothetical protein